MPLWTAQNIGLNMFSSPKLFLKYKEQYCARFIQTRQPSHLYIIYNQSHVIYAAV